MNLTLGTRISAIDMTWTDPYSNLQEHLWLKIFLGSFLLLTQIIGTLFHVSIIMFERSGGDPRKRGLFNQLLSQISGVTVLAYWLTFPVVFWRIILGPVPMTNLIWISRALLNLFSYTGLIGTMDYYVIKFLCVVILKRVPDILDDFVATLLFLVNFQLATILASLHTYTGIAAKSVTKFRGVPKYLAPYTPFNFHVTSGVALTFILVLSMTTAGISVSKRKTLVNPGDHNIDGVRMLNTSGSNKDIVTSGNAITVGLVILSGSAFAIFSSKMTKMSFSLVIYLLHDLGTPFLILIVIPLLIFYGNQDCREYCRKFYKLARQD